MEYKKQTWTRGIIKVGNSNYIAIPSKLIRTLNLDLTKKYQMFKQTNDDGSVSLVIKLVDRSM